jgi:hypothetical protein
MTESKLTYKVKKQLFILLLGLLGALAYQRILKNSYIQTINYVSITSSKISQEQLDQSVLKLKEKIKQLEDILGEENFDENFLQQEILVFLSEKVKENNVEVTNLEKPHLYKENDYLLLTNVFILKGSYNSLIKVIYETEKEFKKSKLNSISFYKKKNYSLKKEELYVELIFQNFKSN